MGLCSSSAVHPEPPVPDGQAPEPAVQPVDGDEPGVVTSAPKRPASKTAPQSYKVTGPDAVTVNTEKAVVDKQMPVVSAKVATGFSVNADVAAACSEAFAMAVKQLEGHPVKFVILHCTDNYDGEAVCAELGQLAPGVPMIGGTVLGGVMTERGFHSADGVGLGVWVLAGEGCFAGVGHASDFHNGPREAARAAAAAALTASRAKEWGRFHDNRLQGSHLVYTVLPIFAKRAHEHAVQGLGEALGPDMYLVGGGSVDRAVGQAPESNEYQMANGRRLTDSATVAVVFFPDPFATVCAFEGAYPPMGQFQGVITKSDEAEGIVYEIDNRPAGDVYNEWCKGALTEEINAGTPQGIIWKVMFNPIAKLVEPDEKTDIFFENEVPHYAMTAPMSVTANKGLVMQGMDIAEGTEIISMQGSKADIYRHWERVDSHMRVRRESLKNRSVVGSIFTYCSGLFGMISGDVAPIAKTARELMSNRPFLGVIAGGEVGHVKPGVTRAGGFMISLASLTLPTSETSLAHRSGTSVTASAASTTTRAASHAV